MTWKVDAVGFQRPNYTHVEDACCRCGTLAPCPPEGQEMNPPDGALGLWRPSYDAPPQWICQKCHDELVAERRK